MDTLEDLAKFVEGRLVEIEARYLKLSDDDEDYLEGLLDAYSLINHKILEILNK